MISYVEHSENCWPCWRIQSISHSRNRAGLSYAQLSSAESSNPNKVEALVGPTAFSCAWTETHPKTLVWRAADASNASCGSQSVRVVHWRADLLSDFRAHSLTQWAPVSSPRFRVNALGQTDWSLWTCYFPHIRDYLAPRTLGTLGKFYVAKWGQSVQVARGRHFLLKWTMAKRDLSHSGHWDWLEIGFPLPPGYGWSGNFISSRRACGVPDWELIIWIWFALSSALVTYSWSRGEANAMVPIQLRADLLALNWQSPLVKGSCLSIALIS